MYNVYIATYYIVGVMNEHISSILKKSGLQAYYDSQKKDINKFAELIIRDCIDEIYTVTLPVKGSSYYKDLVAEHIEKHFGVRHV